MGCINCLYVLPAVVGRCGVGSHNRLSSPVDCDLIQLFLHFVEHVHCLFNMLRDLVREEQSPLGGHSRRSMFPKINMFGASLIAN